MSVPSDPIPNHDDPLFHAKHVALRASGIITYADLYAFLRQPDGDDGTELLPGMTAAEIATINKDS